MFTWCVNCEPSPEGLRKESHNTSCGVLALKINKDQELSSLKARSLRGEGNKNFQPVVTGRCQCGHLLTRQ